MFNFNVPRYEGVVNGALAQRPKIEKFVDEVCNAGYSNLYLIGVGGTWAHYLPIQFLLETNSSVEVHVAQAAEFLLAPPTSFTKDSVAVFCTRTGTTKEIVAAAKFCKEKGARALALIAKEGTPICDVVTDYAVNFAEDDHLGESLYLQIIPMMARFMHNTGDLPNYDAFVSDLDRIAPYLVCAKESVENMAKSTAEKHKDTAYHMVIGSGATWGEAYDYAMCILEEMQWIRTKSIHAGEFFHGTLELLEEGMSVLMLYPEDETRPMMDRVYNFASKITKEIMIFDPKKIELPVADDMRKYLSPMLVYALTERLSAHLEHVRNHPLTMRRYYNQMEY